MLTEICGYLKNWFENTVLLDTFTISDNVITRSDGSTVSFFGCNYFRVVGSKPSINDGIYPVNKFTLQDDTFRGGIWMMAVPADLLTLEADIEAWCEKYAGADSPAMSPFNSESFGGYSYSKSGGSSANGAGASWENAFAARLARFRKL